MSEYFKGVTFPLQEITPSDDAIVRRSILPDRRLSGCELTYSGYTLTMSPGSMLVCGRQFRHTAAQSWAVTGAASGYARLLLTIDVTKASMQDVFEQIYTSIEYASTDNGFSPLRMDDINATGTIYQISVCVLALNANGISQIVDQMNSNQVGAVPTTRTVNGRPLSEDIMLSATDVGAAPAGAVWTATDPNNDGNIVLSYGGSVEGGGTGGGSGGGNTGGGLTAEQVQAMIDASLEGIANGSY